MKTILTHHRPHLDDVCAMWLLKRFLPDYQNAGIDFANAGPVEGGADEADPNKTYVGVGRGKFDEHKGDHGECSASLVLAYVREKASLEGNITKALGRVVDWVLLEDTGKLAMIEYRDFSVSAVLRGEYDRAGKDSHAVASIGFAILDALLHTQFNLIRLEKDWEKRIEFESMVGLAVAIETSAHDADVFAYRKGFNLVVTMNVAHSYHSIRASVESGIDLTPINDELKRREPDAGWFFHHSKQMLICGGDLAPNVMPSRLSMDQLIDVTK
ncbi:MAG: hypothetical protein U9Q03_04910 [Patescibacteria group bacterium]|nr:hypothetical protein [Patescibacteria group bacterium]